MIHNYIKLKIRIKMMKFNLNKRNLRVKQYKLIQELVQICKILLVKVKLNN